MSFMLIIRRRLFPPYWHYLAISIGTLFCTLLGYGILPLLGFKQIASIFSIEHIWLLLGLIMGTALFTAYWDILKKKPLILLVGNCLLIPIITEINSILITHGLNMRWNLITALLIYVPSGMLGFRLIPQQLKIASHTKYYALFFGLLILYFLFYNAHTIVFQAVATADGVYRTLDTNKLFNALTIILGQIAIGYTFLNNNGKYRALFDQFNKILLFMLIAYSLIAIATYPLNVFTVVIEGFKRSKLFFPHPNQFAHYMGFMLIYLTGLFLYYKTNNRLSYRFVLSAILLCVISLLLAMSKTAIVACAFVETGLLLLVAISLPQERVIFKYLLGAFCLGLCSLFLLNLSGKINVFDIISGRFADNTSMTWRKTVWNALLEDINLSTLFYGHGLTASNERLFQMDYVNNLNAAKGDKVVVAIHNAYMDLLYDFGILGLVWITGLFLTFKENISRIFQSRFSTEVKILSITLCCLIILFMISCGFEELFYSNVYPFWFILSILVMMTYREICRAGERDDP